VIINSPLAVMTGDGQGHFTAPTQLFPLGNQPIWISVGDFNKDGKPDVVVANNGLIQSPASTSVLLGNGDGTFQPQTTLPLPANAAPLDVEAADLNGDGNLEIVSSNSNESFLSIYLGNGIFLQPSQAFCAFGPQNIIIQDFGEEDPGILVGKGDGTFEPAKFYGGGPQPLLIEAGSLTPGAKPSLVLVGTSPVYSVLRNTSR